MIQNPQKLKNSILERIHKNMKLDYNEISFDHSISGEIVNVCVYYIKDGNPWCKFLKFNIQELYGFGCVNYVEKENQPFGQYDNLKEDPGSEIISSELIDTTEQIEK